MFPNWVMFKNIFENLFSYFLIYFLGFLLKKKNKEIKKLNRRIRK